MGLAASLTRPEDFIHSEFPNIQNALTVHIIMGKKE